MLSEFSLALKKYSLKPYCQTLTLKKYIKVPLKQVF